MRISPNLVNGALDAMHNWQRAYIHIRGTAKRKKARRRRA